VTKPLGTGLIMTGFKRGDTGTQQLERAVHWMRTLNKDAAEVLRPVEPSAVTDVTGFGLFGHAHEMAERSGVRIRLESERFPAIDGALDLARSGIRTAGDPRNREFAGPHIELDGVPGGARGARLDPQTAGGLLSPSLPSVAPLSRPEFAARRLFLRRIGRVEEGRGRRATTASGADGSQALPAVSPRTSRVRACRCCSLRELFVGITNPDPTGSARAERSGSSPPGVESLDLTPSAC
jgi:hypothetical protein